MRLRIIMAACLALVLSACNLVSTASLPTPTNPPSGPPQVAIISPPTGSEVVVGQDVLISVNAADAVGVTRVQLLADGDVVRTVTSETPGGDQNLNVLLDYEPEEVGTVELEVVAYRGSIASEPAELLLNVRQSQQQVTATAIPPTNVPVINPNDPTCRVLVNTPLNFRTGPSTQYPVIFTLPTGTVAPITGRLGDNSWWQLRVGTTTGWVANPYVTLYGNCSGVAVVQPPPLPATPTRFIITPTNTLTLTPQPPTLTPTPGRPDLIITSISGPAQLTLGAGDTPVTATYAVTITNTGGGSAAQFNNTIQVSPGGSPQQLGVVAGLNPGESIVLTADLSFNSAGTFTIQAQTDSANQIQEASEVNNLGFGSVTVQGSAPIILPLAPESDFVPPDGG